MTAAHTPGPWRHRKHNGEHIIDSTTQYGLPVYVATLITVAPEQGDNEANARLIAAAPELLETLRHVEGALLDITCERTSILKGVRAAIIKATGQAT